MLVELRACRTSGARARTWTQHRASANECRSHLCACRPSGRRSAELLQKVVLKRARSTFKPYFPNAQGLQAGVHTAAREAGLLHRLRRLSEAIQMNLTQYQHVVGIWGRTAAHATWPPAPPPLLTAAVAPERRSAWLRPSIDNGGDGSVLSFQGALAGIARAEKLMPGPAQAGLTGKQQDTRVASGGAELAALELPRLLT